MADRLLDLRSLVNDLLREERIDQNDANLIFGATRSREEAAMHPLVYIASQGLHDLSRPGKMLDDEALTYWLAQQAGLPVVHIDPLKIDAGEVTGVMSYAFAKRHGILCIEVTSDEIVVAVTQPFMGGWEQQLEHVARRQVRRVLANPGSIQRHQVEFYTLSKSVTGAGGIKSASNVTNFEQLLELGSLKDPEANDQHVVNIVDWLLQYAFDQRASDIHIEPRREISRLRFRIDGVLHEVYELPANVGMAVTSRLKVLARMNVAEKRKPQDGRVKTKRGNGSEVELRLSTLPTAFGEKMVLRIFDPEVLLRSFADLGLTGDDYARWQGMVGKTQRHSAGYRPHGFW